MENVRFVQLALHQGKAKKSKAAVTMVNIPVHSAYHFGFSPAFYYVNFPPNQQKITL